MNIDNIIKRIGNLITVKTIVTIMITIVFCILAVKEYISSDVFVTVFSTIIAFYFGTQKIDDNK